MIQNKERLSCFTLNIPLKYNVSSILKGDQNSEFVMEYDEPIVWKQEYKVQRNDAKSEERIEDLQFTLSCPKATENDQHKENVFSLQIENIVAKQEDDAMQMVEKDIHRICQIVSLQTSIHNSNKQAYQPRVQPDYQKVTWHEKEYIVREQTEVEEPDIDEYYDENGKHIIRLPIEENSIRFREHCSLFITLSLKLNSEEFLRYYTMKPDEETDFVMEEFFVALGKENVKSKFFHLFCIIEFVEKRYVDLANAERLLSDSQIEQMLEKVRDWREVTPATRKRVEDSLKNNLKKMTDIGRAGKLVNILNRMGINEIKLCGDTVCIDKEHVQAWINLRNRSYHPDGSVAGEKHIAMETAVTQLMETCQKILLYMMNR